jgi:hypothetical protein
MKGAATWIGFTLAAASAVWGGEVYASTGKGPPRVGGEVEIANVPFDINEVIRTVRRNRGLPEEPPKQGFRAEARGERPFVSKGNAFFHETPRFQAEVGEGGLRYFAQGNKGQPDFEILSVSFEQGGVPQTVFGKGRLEEHAPGLLQGEAQDGVTPYVRNRGEEGIEIYWTIDEPLGPEASALRVRLAIRAAGEPQEHPEGLVFPAWIEEDHVTLSNVIVVDATGRRELVRPSLASGREILFEVSREFLENARYPILIDPTVGPEFPVEPSPVIVPALYYQEYPCVASNGTDYFVAWPDGRSNTDYDIYGARVASDGTVLDPLGIAISTAAYDQYRLSVASNGTDYFVAWEESSFDPDIYGARVASDGTVLDPAGIAVSTATDTQHLPSVASNGTDYFVAWEDWRNWATTNDDIYGARITSAGTVLDPAGIAVSTAANDQNNPSAASNGTDYFIVWDDNRSGVDGDIYGTRLRASDGLLLDGPPDTGGIAVSTAVDDQVFPSATSNGTDYFVAWDDWRNSATTDWDIYGARVTSAGTVPDSAGIAISTAVNDQEYPSAASNGTDYFVAWNDYRSGSNDIYGARVRVSDGLLLDGPPTTGGIAVSTAASNQYDPSVASNGTDYFVVWDDNRSGVDGDIYGARVRASDGLLLDGPPDTGGIAVSTAASWQEYPSAASNGTDYFVAWVDMRNDGGCFCNSDIYGARVASDGTVLDPAGIAVSLANSNQYEQSVASNGTDYFVAWQDFRSGNSYIYGARVQASDGLLLDGPPDTGGIDVSTTSGAGLTPSVASNGTDYFVAWADSRIGAQDIYGARVTSAGTVLDPTGIAVSTAESAQLFPSVASNGTDYFVAWEDWRSGATDIYGARVTSAGTVLDPTPTDIAVSTAAWVQQYLSVASNGTDYFVAWYDNRSLTDEDIYGARVASDGTVLDPAGLLIQQSPSDDQGPAVAHSACGKYLVTYHRFHDDTDFQSQRVMARTIEDDAPPPAEVSAIGSGHPVSIETAGGQIKMIWEGISSACRQYNIYEGDLDSLPPYNHSFLVCWTAGTTEPLTGYLSAVVTPSYVNSYFLVTECDTATEGPSGYDSDTVERDPALNICGPHP